MNEQNKRIIELLAEGKTQKEVAAILKLTKWAVVDRIRTMREKNRCANVTELIAKLTPSKQHN